SAFGIDPLQFGIIMSFNLCIGLVTPPVGICILMTNQIAKANFVETLRSLMPMLILSILVLMLVTFVPSFTLWLPSLLQ
ncbi:MAG: TRAP transporter large permease subunit, partial [Anaerotignum sp.]|nr:TRAP transporter large permease subunit [Anaerotignum sp.]